MALEDHVGDVLAKTRAALGLTTDALAEVAGVAEDQYAALEASGRWEGRVALDRVAARLGLNATKLEGLARGWEPARIDLRGWRELRMLTSGDGNFTVNCYLVWDEATREAALFDTGLSGEAVVEAIETERLQLRHIFITHSHYDHVEALGPIRQRYPLAKVHSSSAHAPVDQRNRPTDFIHVGSLRVTNRDTPGHADDGVTYVVGNWPEDAPSVAMVGDAIFAGSMGKAVAHFELARQKVREQILSLPAETLICPGHGPLTTVGEERGHNPFFG
jgi:glyoxylase-like metal-dependent hydrolase (beta-lactamase superfamily II)